MSEIDPEKVDKSIKWARHIALCGHDVDNLTTLANAAERTLATLPRWKEVEVESWATFSHDGLVWSSGLTERAAKAEADTNPKIVAVRLTGTAKVKVKP